MTKYVRMTVSARRVPNINNIRKGTLQYARHNGMKIMHDAQQKFFEMVTSELIWVSHRGPTAHKGPATKSSETWLSESSRDGYISTAQAWIMDETPNHVTLAFGDSERLANITNNQGFPVADILEYGNAHIGPGYRFYGRIKEYLENSLVKSISGLIRPGQEWFGEFTDKGFRFGGSRKVSDVINAIVK